MKTLLVYGLFFGLVGLLSVGTFVELYRAAWWAPALMLVVPAIALTAYLRQDGNELLGGFRFWWRYERPFHSPSELPPY